MAGGGSVPAWNLINNPIFRRFTRSRLRPKALLPWMLVVGILCAFVFLAIWVGGNKGQMEHAMTARIIFVVLIPVQGLLLMLNATGAVATGMMLEDADGGIEYQRLTPLSPLAKIVGYLFGLPVREYCLFLVTVPFTLIAMLVGQVPVGMVLELYAAFFTSALLYHLIGCVAGTVVNRRFAGRIAQFMVIVLYLVLPQLAKLGFEFFSYLTILPVLSEVIGSLAMPGFQGFFDGIFGTGSRSVGLFGMEVDALPFSLLIQGTLIVSFTVVLYRRWRQTTHHLLGKNFSLGLCVWIHLLLLGSTIPLIDSGEIFPGGPSRTLMARELMRKGVTQQPVKITSPQQKDPRHAYWLAASYGFGALVLSCGLVLIVTPNRDEFTKGLRRARKLGRRRVKSNSDGASGFPHALLIGLAGALAWAFFSNQMFGSRWFTKEMLGAAAVVYSEPVLWLVPFSQLLFVLVFWAVLEWGGRRALLLFGLFVWVVPVLAALILLIAQIQPLAILLGGASAFPSPFYALSVSVEYTRDYIEQMALTFCLTVVGYSLLLAFLIRKVRKRHREITVLVEGAGEAEGSSTRTSAA